MKSVKSLFKGLAVIALLLECGCNTFPVIEVCILGDAGLICDDERIPKEKTYVKRFEDSKNYICTNPQDYSSALEWVRRHDK